MDMGIVNAGQLAVYADLPEDLRNRIEDAVFNRRPDATERLLEIAYKAEVPVRGSADELGWREEHVAARRPHALAKPPPRQPRGFLSCADRLSGVGRKVPLRFGGRGCRGIGLDGIGHGGLLSRVSGPQWDSPAASVRIGGAECQHCMAPVLAVPCDCL